MHDDDLDTGGPFIEVLRNQRAGRTAEELNAGIRELVEAVRLTGKAGTLTVKLRIEPHDPDLGTYTVGDDVKVVLPRAKRHASIYYGTPEGNLKREDPRQGELPGIRTLEDVPEAESRIRPFRQV